MTLSERGGAVDPGMLDLARSARDRFLARSCVGFVVIDKKRGSANLRATAVDILQLTPVHEDERYELLRPLDPPTACLAPAEGIRARCAGHLTCAARHERASSLDLTRLGATRPLRVRSGSRAVRAIDGLIVTGSPLAWSSAGGYSSAVAKSCAVTRVWSVPSGW